MNVWNIKEGVGLSIKWLIINMRCLRFPKMETENFWFRTRAGRRGLAPLESSVIS